MFERISASGGKYPRHRGGGGSTAKAEEENAEGVTSSWVCENLTEGECVIGEINPTQATQAEQ